MLCSRSSLIGFALAGIYFALPSNGQAPSAPPVAAPIARAAGQPDSAQITTLHAHSNLVVIDVVVSDSKQNPVHGLAREDFTLTENGKAQTIRNFEEHTALPASETAKITPLPKARPGIFSNKSAAPANGPVNVLLLDYLNTPLNAQSSARKQLLDYLGKAPPGTRIAIFGLSSSLTMLQGFTSDPEVLKNALTMKKGTPQASDILTDSVNGGVQSNTTLADNFSSDALDAAQQLANINRFQAFETSFEQDLRSKITLGAFDMLARYLVGIPGRKNLIWYSGSFPLSIEPDVNLQDANDSVVRNDEEVRKTDNLLTRAQVAVYPVDARGLMNDPSNSAVNGVMANGGTSVSGAGITPGGTDSATADAQMAFLQQTAQEHETMMAMAEDTGGHAFVNTNNLSQAVGQAIENGSNYYTLTYTPSNAQWDGRFRAIKVKVEHPGVKLAYRNGYYADDPDDRNRAIAGKAATALARPTTMSTAMMHGGPDLSEILFKARIRPSAEPPEEKPVLGNRTNPDPKVTVNGPFKYYGVDLVPDPKSVSCLTGENGNLHCAIEVMTYVYNRDGQLLVTTSANVRSTLSPANYAQMLHDGMAFHEEISVPVKGQYYLRTAIHDLNSDRVGAVEVPVASVAHLAPLDAAPAAPAPAAAAPGATDLTTLMPGLATPAAAPDAPPAVAAPDATPAATPPALAVPAPAAAPAVPAATPR